MKKKTVEQTIDERIIKFLGLDDEICGFTEQQETFHKIRTVLKKREHDKVDLVELLKLFQITMSKKEKKYTSLDEFYNWLMNYRMDEDDVKLYHIYLGIANRLGAPTPDPAAFAGRGSILTKKIDAWREPHKTKNDPEEILRDYIEAVIRVSERGSDFSRERLHKPDALFQGYGWRLWEKFLNECWAGKFGYLQISEEYKKEEREKSDKLVDVKLWLESACNKAGFSHKKRLWYDSGIDQLLCNSDPHKLWDEHKEVIEAGVDPLSHFFIPYPDEDEEILNDK